MNASLVKRRCSPMHEMGSRKQQQSLNDEISHDRLVVSQINQTTESATQARSKNSKSPEDYYCYFYCSTADNRPVRLLEETQPTTTTSFSSSSSSPSSSSSSSSQSSFPSLPPSSSLYSQKPTTESSNSSPTIKSFENIENNIDIRQQQTVQNYSMKSHLSHFHSSHPLRHSNHQHLDSQNLHPLSSISDNVCLDMKTQFMKAQSHYHHHQKHLLLQFLFVLLFTVTIISAESITSTNQLRRVVRGHDKVVLGDYGQYGISAGNADSNGNTGFSYSSSGSNSINGVNGNAGDGSGSHYSQEYSALEELTSALKRIFPVIPERGMPSLRPSEPFGSVPFGSRAMKHYIESSEDDVDNADNDGANNDETDNNNGDDRNARDTHRRHLLAESMELNDDPTEVAKKRSVDRTQHQRSEERKRDTMLVDIQTLRELARINAQRNRMQKLAQNQQQHQQQQHHLQQQRDHRFMRMLLRKLKNRGKIISGVNAGGGSVHKIKDTPNEPVGGNGNNNNNHHNNNSSNNNNRNGSTSVRDHSDVESNRAGSEVDSEKVSGSGTISSHTQQQQSQQQHHQQHQYRSNNQFDSSGRFETEADIEQTETATPSTLGKRGPECMRRCILQGLLHPVQCHSLC